MDASIFGGVCGYLISGWLMEYGNVHPKTIFFITGFVPLVTLLPSVYFRRSTSIGKRYRKKSL